MPTIRVTLPLVLVAALSAACPPAAVGQNMQVTAGGISLGPHLAGPQVPPDALAGRVIMLEFWGVHCGPCIASMPHIEEIHRQLGPEGLLVIGAHAQGGPADEIRKTVRDLGVTFTIVENANVEGGMDFGGIPHCMVFDHTGKCVFRGSPGDAHDVVVAAVKASPAAILSGRTLVKLAPLAQMLKNESLCGTALKKATTLLGSSDEETADEAKFVVERIEAHGRGMLERARELAASDPAGATAAAQRCVAEFRGTEIGGEAGKLLGEWKKDKDFQSALKAGQQIGRLEAVLAAVRQAGAAPPQVVARAREIAKGIEKGWPGSPYAARAAEILAAIDVKPAAP